jgi:hypothetical protein
LTLLDSELDVFTQDWGLLTSQRGVSLSLAPHTLSILILSLPIKQAPHFLRLRLALHVPTELIV